MTEETAAVEIVGIKFRNRGKRYFFDPAGLTLSVGQKVVVETAKGLELGAVIQANSSVPAGQTSQPLRPVVRVATDDDLRIEELCRRREREAYVIGRQKIAAHGLDMKLVDVECSFEGNKILFYFSSDGRVDFRELVKDLASVFRTRIELRQIGVRDEARMLGGLGVCGRPFCCGSFMDEFAPVSTKMAKTQSMSLNPAKISGCCGRLMCCLRYEQAAYEELIKGVPKNGAFVETPDGYGNVTQVNVPRQTVKVKLDGAGDDAFRTYDAEDVAAIPGGRPRDGSQPPHVLVLKPKKPSEPEEPAADWQMPELLITAPDERGGRSVRQEMNRRAGGNRNRPRREPAQAPAARENPGRQRPAPGGGKQGGTPRQEAVGAEKPAQPPKNRSRKRPNKPPRRDDHQAPRREAAPGGQPDAAPKQRSDKAPERASEGAPKQKKPYRGRRPHSGKPKPGGEHTDKQGD